MGTKVAPTYVTLVMGYLEDNLENHREQVRSSYKEHIYQQLETIFG